MFQFISTSSGLIGFILQCFQFSDKISILAGILICICIALNLIIWILYGKNRKVAYGRDKLIEKGKTLIKNTKSKAVLFGSDLSWAKDYLTEIEKVIDSGKEVIIFYPATEKIKAGDNIKKLESLGVSVRSTPVDLGLRVILLEPDNPNDTIVFLTNKVLNEKNLDKNPYIYTSETFNAKNDHVVVNSFTKIYHIVNGMPTMELEPKKQPQLPEK